MTTNGSWHNRSPRWQKTGSMSEQNIQLALKRRGEHETEVHASESQTQRGRIPHPTRNPATLCLAPRCMNLCRMLRATGSTFAKTKTATARGGATLACRPCGLKKSESVTLRGCLSVQICTFVGPCGVSNLILFYVRVKCTKPKPNTSLKLSSTKL